MLLIIRMRGSDHSIDMVEFKIAEKGVVIGGPPRGFRGLTTGVPGPRPDAPGRQSRSPRNEGPRKVPADAEGEADG